MRKILFQFVLVGLLVGPSSAWGGGEAPGVASVPTPGLALRGHPQSLDRHRFGVSGGGAAIVGMDLRVEALPGSTDPDVRRLWEIGLDLEERGERRKAASVYQSIVPQIPDSAAAHWRSARLYWLMGDVMATEEGREAAAYDQYKLAEQWARQGLEIDRNCAECMLWLYASLGRITVSDGVLSGVKYARTMSSLLDDGIALQPAHRDNEYNSTLGNLYYARAIFNRMVPDWWWLKLLVGVRGDKEQALEDIGSAIALNGNRIDYQIEKGAVLLCLGTTTSRHGRIEEGRQALRKAMTFERRFETDELDLLLATKMIEEPGKACGFTREGFLDIEAEADKL